MGITSGPEDIAVVGMAGRFPGAQTLEGFWRNLAGGVESVARFSPEELRAQGVDPSLVADPNYVGAGGVLDDIDRFDAPFFGFSAREAEIMDPQQRVFLECAWAALEDAGHDPASFSGAIGVYAGSGSNEYLLNNLYANPAFLRSHHPFETAILSDKDYLATRVAYKLNLRGPALSIQTACSTSLVAVHVACQGLLDYQCDMALAGGVRIDPQVGNGYLYADGMILSPDGHCRAFDERARGTVRGNGVGVVVLKRLADALEQRDFIYAVIKGSAINNDGANKVGYTAPSVDGQAEVVTLAHLAGAIDPDSISYVETHGTGTSLGDPIEIAALTQAFRARTAERAFCALGAVKTNIGHTDAAAGVAGLIKTCLALRHEAMPPTLHFERPNPTIDFAGSPFYVNARLREWKRSDTPRRAGVSSFGIGGTNAHAIVEEAPALSAAGAARPWQLLLLSAKTSRALDVATTNLAAHLTTHPDLDLADVAFTLQVGRRAFGHRRAIVCRTVPDAVAALGTPGSPRLLTAEHGSSDRPVVFMFPGQGSQHVNMGRDLYDTEPVFRRVLDMCADLLAPRMGVDLRTLLYPHDADAEHATQRLNRTMVAQPAIFSVEYALAQLLLSWGVQPTAMIGHSVGEYVAACLAGVFSLEDALALIATRGQLMDQLPGGAMLAVPLPADEVQPFLSDTVALAAHNAPRLCVLSGHEHALQGIEDRLRAIGVEGRRLHTSHAFHSHMMEAALGPFTEAVGATTRKPAQIPYLSNVSGDWVSEADLRDAGYWARQLRGTVRFSEGVQALMRQPGSILLEVGPGQGLSAAAQSHGASHADHVVIASMKRPHDRQADIPVLLQAVGRLWLAGVRVDWDVVSDRHERRRVPLPTYPFERHRYWIDADGGRAEGPSPAITSKADIGDWFYLPSWKRAAPRLVDESALQEASTRWLVFADESGMGGQLVARLRQRGQDVVEVRAGESFGQREAHAYSVDPRRQDDYDALLDMVRQSHGLPARIVHCWGVTADEPASLLSSLDRAQHLGLYSVLSLARAWGRSAAGSSVDLMVVANQTQDVTGEETLRPDKASVLGATKVIPLEYPLIRCFAVDVESGRGSSASPTWLVDALIAALVVPASDPVVAYRGRQRWVPCVEAFRADPPPVRASHLRSRGVYLITGGLGGVGLTIAEGLARRLHARLILVGRSAFPPRDAWSPWLTEHAEHDPVSRKILTLQACEAAGAELMVCSADVASRAQMRNVVQEARARFGEIHGVIHAAGLADYAGVIDQRTPEMTEAVLAPKVIGTLVLDDLLRETPLDFFVACSSLSSILYREKFGQVGYCAANEFLDAFAAYRSRRDHSHAVSINWPDVREVGMSVDARVRWAARQGIATDSSAYREALAMRDALSPAEVLEVLYRALGATASRVAVSKSDLSALLALDSTSIRSGFSDDVERAVGMSSAHERPSLGSTYVGPRNHTEEVLAEVWQTVLGFERVGVHDNFFELGGHSLVATQIVSRMRAALDVELPLHAFFETPTIAGLAAGLAPREDKLHDQAQLEGLLAELEHLSEAEVEAALGGQSATSNQAAR